MGGGGESSRGKAMKGRGGGGGGGEIVEVEGGHIMKSVGRKDRHSKVCTAKGPRDRRVRLAAHTAIQFYDVQDRLGYDRPSKAVDWLMRSAKSAIDELDRLPPWQPPTAEEDGDAQKKPREEDEDEEEEEQQLFAGKSHEHQRFLPPSLDSDSIADTIRSFFPTAGAPAEPSQSQDLRLSLQSLQDPILLQQQQTHHHHLPTSQLLLSGTPIGSLDAATTAFWPDHHHHHNNPELNSEIGSYNPTQSVGQFHHHHHHNQLFPQRGPLQSSHIVPSIRALMDYYPSSSSADYGHNYYAFHQTGISGFSGFQIPARIRGDEEEEEEHDGYSDKPSSASSDSRR